MNQSFKTIKHSISTHSPSCLLFVQIGLKDVSYGFDKYHIVTIIMEPNRVVHVIVLVMFMYILMFNDSINNKKLLLFYVSLSDDYSEETLWSFENWENTQHLPTYIITVLQHWKCNAKCSVPQHPQVVWTLMTYPQGPVHGGLGSLVHRVWWYCFRGFSQ